MKKINKYSKNLIKDLSNGTVPRLDLRDISIIDALPVYDAKPLIVNVGCCQGRIDIHLK